MFQQRFHLGVTICIQPLVGDACARQELADPEGFRGELRADDPDRGCRSGHQQSSPRHERHEDRVAEPRLRRHQLAQPVAGDRHDLARADHPSRDEDAKPAQHVQLAEEPSGAVVNDDPLLAIDRDDDVDLGADHDEEVVGDVACSVEVVAFVDLAPLAQLRDQRHVRRVECRRGVIHLCHGRGSYGSARRRASDSLSVQQRARRPPIET